MPKISVIVPVFNSEKYLRRCVDSILAQTYSDFELILIDDGSTDGSGAVCDEYAAKDSRVNVYHYPNQGVSAARNHGIEVSQGKWIAFIDSDDYILPDYLSVLYQNSVKYESDLVMTGIKRLYEYDSNKSLIREWPEQMVEKKQIDLLYERKILQYQKGPVIKLFKKEIIDKHNLRFNEKLSLGEDALFVYSYLLHTNTLSVAPGASYVYCIRRGSLTSQRLADFEDELYGYECTKSVLVKLLDQASINHPYLKDYLAYCFDRVLSSLYVYKNKYKRSERIQFLKSLDLSYYKAWKRPVSKNESFVKWLLCERHYRLFDVVSNRITCKYS